jgi:acyl carrier protein
VSEAPARPRGASGNSSRPLDRPAPVTLPPDLRPVVPQFFREWCTVGFAPDGPGRGGLLTALAAVLARYTGRDDIVVGALEPRGAGCAAVPRAYRPRPQDRLGELAPLDRAELPAPPVAGAELNEDPRTATRFAAPAGHDVVVYLTPAGLTANYDADRYAPDGIRSFLTDVATVLRELATHPDTPVGRLPVGRRETGAAPPTPHEPPHEPLPEPPPEPPQGPVERAVAEIWSGVLDGLAPGGIGRDSGFFALGGDSLAAVRATNRLRDRFDVELPGTWSPAPGRSAAPPARSRRCWPDTAGEPAGHRPAARRAHRPCRPSCRSGSGSSSRCGPAPAPTTCPGPWTWTANWTRPRSAAPWRTWCAGTRCCAPRSPTGTVPPCRPRTTGRCRGRCTTWTACRPGSAGSTPTGWWGSCPGRRSSTSPAVRCCAPT